MKDNYANWSRQDLIDHIELLEAKLKNENDFLILNFPWAGNLGQWVWHYDRNVVFFNDKKATQIGYDPASIGSIGFEFFTSKLHPEDYDRVMENMKNHLSGVTPAYEVEYRIRHRDGHYIWYYDRGTVTKRDQHGHPVLIEGIVFDISESKKLEASLLKMAQTDSLTGVYNRRMFFNDLHQQIQNNLKQQIPFSLIMLDIDYFKQINDTYGHLVGDKVLVELVKRISNHDKTTDRIYRYGGDEFFVLLPGSPLEEAQAIALRLHQSLTKEAMPVVGEISISMGVAEYHQETDDAFLKMIDDRLYQAKHEGRNRIIF